MVTYKEFLDKRVFDLLAVAVADLDCNAYVVGGYVRDKIMGRDCVDIENVGFLLGGLEGGNRWPEHLILI